MKNLEREASKINQEDINNDRINKLDNYYNIYSNKNILNLNR